jgi:hypothetical protein
MKGAPTQSVSANNSRGCSARLTTGSDPEATRTSHLRNNNRHDDRHGCGDNDHRDDRQRDNQQPEDRHDERDLPPLPETGNPNGPFQKAKRSVNMVVSGLKSSSSRRRCRKDNREVKLIHAKPSPPLHWLEQPITFSRADHWVHIPDHGSYAQVVEPIVEGALLP